MVAHVSPVDIEMLRKCYHECTTAHGFISFTKDVRKHGHYHIKLHNLITLFKSSTTWQQVKNSSGHKIFKNKITSIVVNIQAHKKSGGDKNVDPGAVITILGQVQDHLNIMCNDIFKYTVNNWKTEPDYKSALANYRNRV